MSSTCSEYEVHTLISERVVLGMLEGLVLSMCESSFDLQFSVSDITDDENAELIKIRLKLLMNAIYHQSPGYVGYMTVRFSYCTR